MQNKDFEEFSKSTYKTDGEGNELAVYDCLNRKERRKLWREAKRTGVGFRNGSAWGGMKYNVYYVRPCTAFEL